MYIEPVHTAGKCKQIKQILVKPLTSPHMITKIHKWMITNIKYIWFGFESIYIYNVCWCGRFVCISVKVVAQKQQLQSITHIQHSTRRISALFSVSMHTLFNYCLRLRATLFDFLDCVQLQTNHMWTASSKYIYLQFINKHLRNRIPDIHMPSNT